MSRLFVLLNHPPHLKIPYVVSILRETPLVASVYRETNGYLTPQNTERLGFFAGSMVRGLLLPFTPRIHELDSPDPCRGCPEWRNTHRTELV